MSKRGVETEVHRARNQLSVLKVYVDEVKVKETTMAKGEFTETHMDKFERAVRAIDETLNQILQEIGEKEGQEGKCTHKKVAPRRDPSSTP